MKIKLNTQTVTNVLLGAILVMMLSERVQIFNNITDPINARFNHSGMNLVFDNDGQCQYLVTRQGGITPQLHKGQPVCNKVNLTFPIMEAASQIGLFEELWLTLTGKYNFEVWSLVSDIRSKQREQAKKEEQNPQH